MNHAPIGSTDHEKITLATLREMKARSAKFSMLTAYDYPTARLAEEAGVHCLLVGDSLGTVLLGHENTRSVPLELMIVLTEAVRRGAPRTYLVGDMPFLALAGGDESALRAAARFRAEAGCDAIKLETRLEHRPLIEQLARAGITVIVHLGLRPQEVLAPDGYRAQARDTEAIGALANEARALVAAGAAMVLLEAVPNEASAAVIGAVNVPVIGCGAGPACDGHVVVTYDMIGLGAARPPRFVPILGHSDEEWRAVMRQYVADVTSGVYPAPKHGYSMKAAVAAPGRDR